MSDNQKCVGTKRQHSMNIFQPRRGSVDLDLEQDYISNLPINIKEEILMKLGIEEAVRTSLLSTKWKYAWMSIPNLVFIKDYYSQSKLTRLVSQVLLLHRGSILQFKLHTRHACKETIDRWMLILSRNGIKNLYIKLDSSENCSIPCSFFSCLVLEHVHIYWGTLHVPLSFQGFKFLRILSLFSCNFPGTTTIARFISSCPLLESLDLDGFVEFGRLVIRAPNLRWLSISGEFDDLCLETPKLRVAHINPYFGYYRNCKSDILRVFGSLSAIEELELRSDFISYLAKGPIPEMLPVPLCRLTKLHIVLDSYKEEIAVAWCLFKNAPNLKVLTFMLHEEKSYPSSSLAGFFWEVKGIESDLFNCLEIVNIPYLQYPESVLNVSKFVLSTAPVLEKLVIQECCIDVSNLMDGMAFLKKLASFLRLSKMARIEFVEDFLLY